MQKPEVEICHKNIRLFNKISIILNQMYRYSPRISAVAIAVGVVDLWLKDIMPEWVRPLMLFTLYLSAAAFVLYFVLQHMFRFLWKCPVCKEKFPWYVTTLGRYSGEGKHLRNETVKEICDRKDKTIPLLQFTQSSLLIPKKCPHCGEVIWK